MPAAQRSNPVTIEDARIVFRNFSGEEGRFNAKGDRNFNVLLDDETAEAMIQDGWNIKYLKPREDGDVPQARLEVSVSYKGKPPRVVMITSRGRTNLDEGTISILDWAEFELVDLIINPYHWDVNGKTGIKAYLKTIFVTIREDALEQKYADVPDSAMSSMIVDAEIVDEDDPREITTGRRAIER